MVVPLSAAGGTAGPQAPQSAPHRRNSIPRVPFVFGHLRRFSGSESDYKGVAVV